MVAFAIRRRRRRGRWRRRAPRSGRCQAPGLTCLIWSWSTGRCPRQTWWLEINFAIISDLITLVAIKLRHYKGCLLTVTPLVIAKTVTVSKWHSVQWFSVKGGNFLDPKTVTVTSVTVTSVTVSRKACTIWSWCNLIYTEGWSTYSFRNLRVRDSDHRYKKYVLNYWFHIWHTL